MQEEQSAEQALENALRVIQQAAVKRMEADGKDFACFTTGNFSIEVYMLDDTLDSEAEKIVVTDLMIGSQVGDLSDGSVIRREDGLFMRLTPDGWETVTMPPVQGELPKHQHLQKWTFPPEPKSQPPVEVPHPVMTKHGPCPLSKDPCKMNDPTCNVSPGIFIADVQGKQVTMCGDCLNQMGAQAIASARSIG